MTSAMMKELQGAIKKRRPQAPARSGPPPAPLAAGLPAQSPGADNRLRSEAIVRDQFKVQRKEVYDGSESTIWFDRETNHLNWGTGTSYLSPSSISECNMQMKTKNFFDELQSQPINLP